MQTTINVGKQGLTKAMLEEIKLHVKRHKIVRVKFLASAPDRKKEVAALAEKVGLKQKKKVGFVVVLEKK